MATGRTHVGKVRTNNEDCFSINPALGLYMVADGMGGHASGEVASRMATDIITETFEKSLLGKGGHLVGKHDPQRSDAANRLLGSIRLANKAVFELSQKESQYHGMGTTLVGLLAQEEHLILFHVGDSRIYRLHETELHQLTEDHSLVVEQLKLGLLTEEEAKASRAKNVITRAIGVFRDVEVDMVEIPWVERDIYLLCSDGLSDFVPLEEIKKTISSGEHDLEALNDALIQSALDQGGHDNVTVVLLQLGKAKSKFKALKGTLGKILGNRPDS